MILYHTTNNKDFTLIPTLKNEKCSEHLTTNYSFGRPQKISFKILTCDCNPSYHASKKNNCWTFIMRAIGKIVIICAVILFLVAYFHYTQVGTVFDKLVQVRDNVQNATDPIIKNILQSAANSNLTKH